MIHNDCSKKSVNLLTDNQLEELSKICEVAEGMFSPKSQNLLSKPYRLAEVLDNIDVWLVPVTAFQAHVKSWCDNAKDVCDNWFDDIKRAIENVYKEYRRNFKDHIDIEPEEEGTRESEIKRYEQPLELLPFGPSIVEEVANRVLGPWRNCARRGLYYTYYPLGWFDGKAIYICFDLIVNQCKNWSNADELATKIFAITLLHELAHAMMYNPACGPDKINNNPYLYWTEEALANRIMLDYLSAYSSGYFKEALSFVAGQHGPYERGILLYMNNVADYEIYRKQKAVTNREKGLEFVGWLAILRNNRFFQRQLERAFNRMVNVYTLSDSWNGICFEGTEEGIKKGEDKGILEYSEDGKSVSTGVKNWSEVYANFVQILANKYPLKVVSSSLPVIGGTTVRKAVLGNNLVVDTHCSNEKKQDRIKEILNKMYLQDAQVRIYIKYDSRLKRWL